jgi:hypothetical protein
MIAEPEDEYDDEQNDILCPLCGGETEYYDDDPAVLECCDCGHTFNADDLPATEDDED